MTCLRCADHGLIRVAYESGEPFDLAICGCRFGQFYRGAGERPAIPDASIRRWLGLDDTHRIALAEDFEDEPMAVVSEGLDFTQATKQTRKRAKL